MARLFLFAAAAACLLSLANPNRLVTAFVVQTGCSSQNLLGCLDTQQAKWARRIDIAGCPARLR